MINSHRGSKEYGNDPNSRVWSPLRLGSQTLKHRIAMAPLTRFRAENGVVTDMHAEYYSQRATNGGLLITEATFIAYEAGGYPKAPGIYNNEQITAWKKVTDAVHAKGGVIYCQLWALGRANRGADPKIKIVSSSTTPFEGGKVPQQMSVEDIKRYMDHYRHAAQCAMEAGFDGVEVHGAHGYLVDQFLQKLSNSTRNDEYSGSLENRSRFLLEALDSVAEVVGQDKVAVRVSPFSLFQGQGADDPFETWGYALKQVQKKFPKLAYVSITDPRLDSTAPGGGSDPGMYSTDKFRAIFRGIDPNSVSKLAKESTTVFPEPDKAHPTVVLAAGGYTPSAATSVCNRTGDLIGYGRLYIANPDLVHRIRNGLELNAYNRNTFYTAGPVGYTDYPFATKDTKKFVPEVQNKL